MKKLLTFTFCLSYTVVMAQAMVFFIFIENVSDTKILEYNHHRSDKYLPVAGIYFIPLTPKEEHLFGNYFSFLNLCYRIIEGHSIAPCPLPHSPCPKTPFFTWTKYGQLRFERRIVLALSV
ncbi:hypothetical protein [Emticicia agri]|uniref:Uncharacterized protein n=1 Tax=Emticicia agri TaxID=2492393 RepID=A0A4Q5M3M0_9BACT|nr:hypothetical protein [Emticicia agri]RYU96679.1 hypothetical protein EWM59_05890 [Emticicia agri]